MDKKEFARYLNEQMALYEKDRLSETKLTNALGMSQKSIAEVSWTELLELLASAKTVEELDSQGTHYVRIRSEAFGASL